MIGRCLMTATVLAAATPSQAQSYDQSGARGSGSGEYGSLVRRATGMEPRTVRSEIEPSDFDDGRRPAPRVSRDDAETSEFLNDPSDFSDEPHRVRIVDRSRYDEAFVPTTMEDRIGLAQGDVLVDTRARQLYVGLGGGMVRRFGIAVGKAGKAWHGTATIGRKARWPDWHPTANIRRENRRLKARVAGGASNPLGARALYLFQDGRDTLYRIHGTNQPSSIGRFASHGCIRMINEDVIELYGLVGTGSKVTVS